MEKKNWLIFVQKAGTSYCKVFKSNLTESEALERAEKENLAENGSGYYYIPQEKGN